MDLHWPPLLAIPSANDRALPIPSHVMQEILNNPTLIAQLCDRVQTLLEEDLKNQRERNYGYGRRF